MAEIRGGPMAHQLQSPLLHNHRGGLVQPSLVINQNNMDYRYSQNNISTFLELKFLLNFIQFLKVTKFLTKKKK